MCVRKDVHSLSLQILMTVRVLHVMIMPLVPTLLVASAVRVILATPAMGLLALVGPTHTLTHSHKHTHTHTHTHTYTHTHTHTRTHSSTSGYDYVSECECVCVCVCVCVGGCVCVCIHVCSGQAVWYMQVYV